LQTSANLVSLVSLELAHRAIDAFYKTFSALFVDFELSLQISSHIERPQREISPAASTSAYRIGAASRYTQAHHCVRDPLDFSDVLGMC
jgi:hypothetical protein